MPTSYPIEFRRDVVAVARKHEAPLAQIAKDFGISETCLSNWLKKADIDDGVRPGSTEKDSAELRDVSGHAKLPIGGHGNCLNSSGRCNTGWVR